LSARDFSHEGRLSRFSLDRRVTVLVLFLTTLVVGAVAASRIPVELIPSGHTEPFLSIYVPWESAPSREVLDKVTLPLEEELSTVRGIDVLFSVSRTGMGRAFMRFKHGTDMDVAYREVRARVERARARFPDDIDRVYIRKDDTSGIPVYMLGVAVDDDVVNSYDLIENRIIKRLSRLEGVATVEAEGLVEKEILIELDREKTAAAGLNIFELGQELGQDNFTLASGTVRDGSRKLLLRSVARYADLEALENRLRTQGAAEGGCPDFLRGTGQAVPRARHEPARRGRRGPQGGRGQHQGSLQRGGRGGGGNEGRSASFLAADAHAVQPGRGDRRVAEHHAELGHDRRHDRRHRAALLPAPFPSDRDPGPGHPVEH